MPFIHVTWLPKACRTASTRKEVADAIIKAVTAVKSADIAPENLVVRFSESVGGFPLPKGFSEKYARARNDSHIASRYLRSSTLAMQPRPFGAGQGTMRPQAHGLWVLRAFISCSAATLQATCAQPRSKLQLTDSAKHTHD